MGWLEVGRSAAPNASSLTVAKRPARWLAAGPRDLFTETLPTYQVNNGWTKAQSAGFRPERRRNGSWPDASVAGVFSQ